LRNADGRIEELVTTGALLGLGQTHLEQATVFVPPGSALAFFTDGLSESTRDIDDGYQRIHAALAAASVRAAENPARALVEHVLDHAPARDDIAVLVMQTAVEAPELRHLEPANALR
jgi:serine phosphatase RsbU (regulator of sigma subunit)